MRSWFPSVSNYVVRFYVHDTTALNLTQVLTLTDEKSNGAPVVANLLLVPAANSVTRECAGQEPGVCGQRRFRQQHPFHCQPDQHRLAGRCHGERS